MTTAAIARTVWYREIYLKSYGWLNTRWHYMERVGWRCEGNYGNCQRWARIVHHLSYENLGEEKPHQLLALCHECHDRLHRRAHDLVAANDNQLVLDFGKTG